MGYKGKTTSADLQREVQNNKVQAMKARNEAYELRKENERLREALEFYADEKKYSTHMNEFGFYLPVCVGKGKIARKALEGESK